MAATISTMTTRQLCSMVKERERGSANNAFILLGVDYCTERRGGRGKYGHIIIKG